MEQLCKECLEEYYPHVDFSKIESRESVKTCDGCGEITSVKDFSERLLDKLALEDMILSGGKVPQPTWLKGVYGNEKYFEFSDMLVVIIDCPLNIEKLTQYPYILLYENETRYGIDTIRMAIVDTQCKLRWQELPENLQKRFVRYAEKYLNQRRTNVQG